MNIQDHILAYLVVKTQLKAVQFGFFRVENWLNAQILTITNSYSMQCRCAVTQEHLVSCSVSGLEVTFHIYSQNRMSLRKDTKRVYARLSSCFHTVNTTILVAPNTTFI